MTDLIEPTDLRERRRSDRWIRNALRERVKDFDAWWADFGRALGVMAPTFAALLPVAALVVWAAIEVTS